jgi:predicted permease
LSLALVLGGALFLRTFSALTTASLGIDPGPVAIFDISASRLSNEEAPARFVRLQQEVEALPGAAVAAWSEITPAGGARWNTIIQTAPGLEALTERQRLAWVNPVTTGWFKAYGIPLRQGRDFDEHDVQTSTRVAIVNESFARKYLPGRAAVGSEFKTSPEGPTVVSFQVVGMVGDSIYRSPRAGLEPIVYFPLTQMNAPKSLSLSVRTAGSPAALMPSIARTIARSMPESSFTSRLLTDQLGATVRQERLVAILAGFFGGLALLLAALGLYGVTSYAVSRRRAEIGIRMALGADRAGVLRLVISRVLWLVVIGVALGGLLSVWASQYIETLLFKVTARDPTTFAIATAVLVSAALLAGWLPARRAASIDPATVLRES